MTSCSQLKTVESLVAAFDEHLRRVRGVCLGTRRNYGGYVGQFLVTVFGEGVVQPMKIGAPEVVAFVADLAGRYRPRTVELRRRRCVRSFGFCAWRGLVTTGWRTRSRWCRVVTPALFGTWILGLSSS
jgi:hypothetical protein